MSVQCRNFFIRARINCTLRVIFLFASLFINEREVKAIDCYVGYGQEGREYISGIEWPRKCPNTNYCFMAVTTDIEKAKALLDFTWDAYYDLFYLKSCGGDFGTPLNTSSLPRGYFQEIKITVSPRLVTGQGGTELFSLKYTCAKNMCSSAWKQHNSYFASIAIPILLIGLGCIFSYF